jgi:hypothetical protein
MKRLDATARRLTDLLLPVMGHRIEKLGVDTSGAFNFYRSRFESGRVFCDYEIQLVKEIVNRQLPVAHVHEIGCGWGQLIFLLAWSGYDATGFEIDDRRFAGADYLRRVLDQIDPDRSAGAKIRHEFFPPADRPDQSRSLVIATNVVVGDRPFVEEQMIWALRRYRFAIIDVDRFCRRRGRDDRPALIALVEEAGLKNLGLFCDAGGDGQFYLFESDGTARERAVAGGAGV